MGVISRYPLVQNMRQSLPLGQVAQHLISRLLPRPVVQMVDVQCGGTVVRLLQADLGQLRHQLRALQMQAFITFVRHVQTSTSVVMGLAPMARELDGPDNPWLDVASELHERFRLTMDRDDTSVDCGASSLVVQALVGSGLSVLDTEVLTVAEPMLHEPPQLLRLRWALPMIGMNGSS